MSDQYIHLFSYSSYQKVIDSIDGIIAHMINLEKELENTDLHNLRAFNHTYLIITKAVAAKLNTGYFQDDLQMEQLDINFAYYYFNALYNYIHKKSVPPSWKLLFDACKQGNKYQFIYMALGVNAHVNNDLGQSLNDVIKNIKYREDFDKVNQIIHNNTKEVVEWLDEKSSIIDHLKNIFQPLYAFVLDFIIRKWRDYAWKNFLELQGHKITKDQIEQNALGIGIILSKIRKFI